MIWKYLLNMSKMLSSSQDTLLKVSKTTSPQKLFDYDCVTLYQTLYLTLYIRTK